MSAVLWAKHFANEHVHEEGGNNHGKLVEVFLRFVGARPGDPWCAAFVSYCFHKAAVEGEKGATFPYSASSQAIKRYAEQHDLLSHDPQDLMKWKGAVAGWTDADGAHGHVFFVSERLTNDHKMILAIRTVEGNTSPQDGARDGQGVYSIERKVPVAYPGHRLWFVNTSGFAGGSWWK